MALTSSGPAVARPARSIWFAVSYVLVAVAFTWPLSARLSSHIMGPPGSDLGVYVWNLWVFAHEAAQGHFPLWTTTIFSLDGPVDLSLHNYTLLADLLAWPLLPRLGLVTTFNVLCLANLVAGAFAMFLLARHLTDRTSVSWLAGLLFGFSPTLVARSTIHPSLAAAAPLPLFTLALLRLDETHATRWAIAAGVAVAWAGLCDPYYAIYCLVIAVWHLAFKALHVDIRQWRWLPTRRAMVVLDALAVVCSSVTFAILVTGGFSFAVGTTVVHARTTYTPAMLLTACLIARALLTLRPRVSLRPRDEWLPLLRIAPSGILVGAGLLSPVLYALVVRSFDGRFVSPQIHWRTSTPGVDLLSFIVPNPNNSWFGGHWNAWLTTEPGGFAENVVSVTLVGLGVIVAARVLTRFSLPLGWTALAVGAASCAVGPFVRIAGTNTTLPSPWSVLRYVPVLSAARSPARFAVLMMLGVTVLFAFALSAILARYERRRRLVFGVVVALMALELLPAPRELVDARPPLVYQRIADDPRDIRVLELPFGVRDGLSSFGNFSAASQFYQAHHHKRLIGGYLSRVQPRRVVQMRQQPPLAALLALSEGAPLSQRDRAQAVEQGPWFAVEARLGYVVVDHDRASPMLIAFAREAFRLESLGQSGSRELLRPRSGN